MLSGRERSSSGDFKKIYVRRSNTHKTDLADLNGIFGRKLRQLHSFPLCLVTYFVGVDTKVCTGYIAAPLKNKMILELDKETHNEIKERLESELVQPNFNVTDQNFQILSTIRYDPNFTTSFSTISELPEIDPQLSSLIHCEEFLENVDNDSVMDYLESTSSTVGDSYSGEVDPFLFFKADPFFHQSSVPSDNHRELSKTSTEHELQAIFYNRFFLLGEHYKRLRLAFHFFQWPISLSPSTFLNQLIASLPVPTEQESSSNRERMLYLLDRSTCYKMRVLISKNGSMEIEAHELPTFTLETHNTHEYIVENLLTGFLDKPPTWDVYINTEPIVVSPFTLFKTTRRDHYNKARRNMDVLKMQTINPRHHSEILVYNDLYQLMEGSITNVAVKMASEIMKGSSTFTTPCLSAGCLCGVTRFFLLRKGLLQEDNVDVRTLKVGDEVLLFNGIMGCVKGVIRNSIESSN